MLYLISLTLTKTREHMERTLYRFIDTVKPVLSSHPREAQKVAA